MATWRNDNPAEYSPMPVVEEEPGAQLTAPATPGSHIAKLRLLWDERRFLFRLALLGFVCSAIIAMLIPKRYDATTRLMPPDSGSDSMAMLAAVADKAGALGNLAGGLLGTKSSSDVLVGVLSSNTLRDRLIDRFELRKVYGVSLQEDARERLSSNTAIGLDRKSGILTVTVNDHDPARAQVLANAYVEELNVLTGQLSTSAAHRERVFLEGRLHEVSQDLEKAEKELSQYASKNATLSPQDQGKAIVEAAANLQGRLAAAQAQLEGLRSIYSDNSARVRAMKAEIVSLQAEVQRMGGKAGEADLNASTQLSPSIRQLPLLAVTWADLFRRAKVEEAVFEVLTKQYELAKVQEAKEIPSVKILDRAEVPQKKSYPPRIAITLAGAFFALVFGILWTLGFARWGTVDPQHPGKVLAIEMWNTFTSPARKLFSRRSSWRQSNPVVIHPGPLHDKGRNEEDDSK